MIDCHCHLADERLFFQVDAVLTRSISQGLRYFIFGGVSPDEWQRQERVLGRLPKGCFARTCFGLHPVWVAQEADASCEQAFRILETKISRADALGETGLDFRKAWAGPEARARQERWFRAHLELAVQTQKTLVLHVVHAHDAALKMCREFSPELKQPAGMVHGFTGSREVAKAWLDLGFYISIGTRILYENNQRLRDLAAWLPLDRLLVESDAPDQRPPMHAAEFNEPWTSVQVMEAIATARNISVVDVEAQVFANVQLLFGPESVS